MEKPLYNPFRDFIFDDKTCFLTGNKLDHSEQFIHAFPKWILDTFNLNDTSFKLLDESFVTYKDIHLPSSPMVSDAFEKLDLELEPQFKNGFESAKSIPEVKLFQWIAKLVYGIIVFELNTGIRQQKISGEPFSFSQALVKKFGNLHLMLQSIIRPVEFEGNYPWAIKIFKVNNKPGTFNYRDEINTLTFSMQMEDFGIIACLQDNGANALYHKEILKKIGEHPLHSIQFQEICGRFFYSNYLFNRLPEYNVMETSDAVFVEPMQLQGMDNKPVFDPWQNKTYAQVLENFWKPWGFLLFEILKNPEKPMSFLTDENDEFIVAENIESEG